MSKLDAVAIRRFRLGRGWTQSQLAERLGTDAVTVSRWERGVSQPRRSARVRLAELMPAPKAPRRTVRFARDPAARLREIDRARREQIELRRTMRAGR